MGFFAVWWGMDVDLKAEVRAAGEAARGALWAERTGRGWWEGELSSSALATAVAVLAFGALVEGSGENTAADLEGDKALMRKGLGWLAGTQLADGGWGDTRRSRANVATTLLGWAAFGMGARVLGEDNAGVVDRAEGWLRRLAGSLEPVALVRVLEARYGKDKTFAVPILMACAVGGRLGESPGCWREVPALPFELAAFPRRWFAALKLPVVSYALPALIAIGQVREHHAPGRGPWRWVRRATVGRTRRLLREIQPEGGGFLEATPLTGFVTMALCSAGQAGDAVVREAAAFLRKSVRADGSWPIDTNLATWGTTLSVKALGGEFPGESREVVRNWLLEQQYQVKHPYCMSAPGGWAWTDLPGGVPDADDTAGALLALAELGGADGKAAAAGCRWLAGLQNGDGGVPTFCKGWGALPFDRSAPDLTGHALAAWEAWRGKVDFEALPAMRRAVAWLGKTQRADGSWVPLWFGNEAEVGEENPVYGTATVLKYLCRLQAEDFGPAGLAGMREKAARYLYKVTSRADGTWSGGGAGGVGSVEETGAAVEALLDFDMVQPGLVPEEVLGAGLRALVRLTEGGQVFEPAPIGLYFARLWYYERLYPMIAAVAAFSAAERWGASRARGR